MKTSKISTTERRAVQHPVAAALDKSRFLPCSKRPLVYRHSKVRRLESLFVLNVVLFSSQMEIHKEGITDHARSFDRIRLGPAIRQAILTHRRTQLCLTNFGFAEKNFGDRCSTGLVIRDYRMGASSSHLRFWSKSKFRLAFGSIAV